jgi:hypothetical protein
MVPWIERIHLMYRAEFWRGISHALPAASANIARMTPASDQAVRACKRFAERGETRMRVDGDAVPQRDSVGERL